MGPAIFQFWVFRLAMLHMFTFVYDYLASSTGPRVFGAFLVQFDMCKQLMGFDLLFQWVCIRTILTGEPIILKKREKDGLGNKIRQVETRFDRLGQDPTRSDRKRQK